MNESANNKASALAGLLNKLDLPTLITVLVMGSGNWFATKEDGRLTREEAERVAREVHELHSKLSDWETRQKTALEKIDQIVRWQQNHP